MTVPVPSASGNQKPRRDPDIADEYDFSNASRGPATAPVLDATRAARQTPEQGDSGLRERAAFLADRAAHAVTEPRRFHESSDEQHDLGVAIADVRAALAGAPEERGLDALRKLSEDATPGPWVPQSPSDGQFYDWYLDTHHNADGPEPVWANSYPVNGADIEFIAAAVNYVRARLATPEAAPEEGLTLFRHDQPCGDYEKCPGHTRRATPTPTTGEPTHPHDDDGRDHATDPHRHGPDGSYEPLAPTPTPTTGEPTHPHDDDGRDHATDPHRHGPDGSYEPLAPTPTPTTGEPERP